MNKHQKSEREERMKANRERAEIVVRAIGRGASAKDALLTAGYSEATAAHHAKKILKGRYIKEAVERIGESITNKSNSSLAKFRLQDLLLNPKADLRVLVQGIRMALEANAEIGARAELNLNQQNNFSFGTPPPQAALIMARRFKEILTERIASGEVTKGSDEEISFLKEITKLQVIGAPALAAQRILPRAFQESATVEEDRKDYV